MSEIPEDGLEFIKQQRARRELGVSPKPVNREFGFDSTIFIPGVTDACFCGVLVDVPDDWDKPENFWVAGCDKCNEASANPENYK